MGSPTVFWFRQDLRLDDNAAFSAAIERGECVLPVYIWAPDEEGHWAPGGASRWWLYHALKDLDDQLVQLGSRLILRIASWKQGTEQVLLQICRETGADHVLWNRRYEPASIKRDTALKRNLGAQGLQVRSFNSSLLLEPTEIRNKSGKPFQVFTRYLYVNPRL